MNALPSISVVVPCLNRVESVRRVILAIQRQLDWGQDELIVVDNGSTDGSLEEITAAVRRGGKMMHVSERGRTVARNAGASIARADVLLFIDADMLPCADLVQMHRLGQNDDHCALSGFVGGASAECDVRWQAGLIGGLAELSSEVALREIALIERRWRDWRLRHLEQWGKPNLPWIGFTSANASVRRAEFHAVGGFDERIRTWASEDIDLGYRLHARSGVAWLDRALALHWPHPRNRITEWQTNRENQFYMLGKFPELTMEGYIACGAAFLHLDKTVAEVLSQIKGTSAGRAPSKCELLIDCEEGLKPVFRCRGINRDGVRVEWPLVGLAIPSFDNSFDVAEISSSHMQLPESLVVRVLQEALRVAAKVVLQLPKSPSNWPNEIGQRLDHNAYWGKVFHRAVSLDEFDFNGSALDAIVCAAETPTVVNWRRSDRALPLFTWQPPRNHHKAPSHGAE